jgi:HlyD family secretion protein
MKPSMKHSGLFGCIWLGLALTASATLSAAESRPVGALGRLQPASGIIELGTWEGQAISEVLVAVGDKVTTGQPLVKLAARDTAELELKLAQLALNELVQTGPLAVRAAELTVKQAEADHALAKERLARYTSLNDGAISPQESLLRQNRLEVAAIQVEQAKAALDATIGKNKNALDRARIQVALAQRKLDSMTFVAPSDGTILELSAVVGGRVGPLLVKMADTRRMIVLAEVFEGELGRLRTGASCEVTHEALGTKPLTGRLTRIGRVVSHPGKVAQVWIELDRPEPADRFVGMEVNVTIRP